MKTDGDGREKLQLLKAKVRRLESMVYQRDLVIASKYRYEVTQDILREAFRRIGFPGGGGLPYWFQEMDFGRLSLALEAALNRDVDETLKKLKNVTDTIVCGNCRGNGCEECDLTGVPGPQSRGGEGSRFRGSGKRVIRKTGGLT